MGKVLTTTGIAVILATAYYIYSSEDSRPEFVVAAEAEANNFLQYTYGPGKCVAKPDKKAGWSMACSYEKGNVLCNIMFTRQIKPRMKRGTAFIWKRQISWLLKAPAKVWDASWA